MNLIIPEKEIKELVERAIATSEDHIKNQRFPEAERLLKQTIKVDAKCERAMRLLTDILLGQQKESDAIPFYERLLELHPDEQVSLNNLSLCYSSIGEKDKALAMLMRCAELYPDQPSSHSNLALQYKDMGDNSKALQAYLNGVAALPDSHDIRFNFGVFLAEGLRFHEAIEQYKKVVELQPEFFLAHFNMSLINLLLGNYKEGWKDYEWRFGHQVFKNFKSRFNGPEWGGEDGHGKIILVYNEQGAGDAIQFSRYLPELKKRGFKVVLEVVYELVDLMSQCEGADQVIPQRSRNAPKYDYHVSIGSLPWKLGIYAPFSSGKYLKPTGSLGSQAFDNYSQFTKVGICWAGNPIHRHDSHRSCRLKHFKHLNSPEIKLFSLQKDSRPRFWAGEGVVDLTEGCDDMGIVDLSDLLINFNYTAAIMEQMKCIVTVDTAVAHIAGAMNLPCYLLLPHMPDWRWGTSGEKNDWYDSIKLVRQPKSGDYDSQLENVAQIVKTL